MKRKFLSFLMLFFSAILFLACSNLLDADKKSSKSTGISLSLPYAKSNKVGVFRSGSEEGRLLLKFDIVFTHESGKETSFEGESGQTIVFDEAQTGSYKISVHGYNERGDLEFEGTATADVFESQTTTVKIKLTRVKGKEEVEEPIDEPDSDVIYLNFLTHSEEQEGMFKEYTDTHPDCSLHIEYKKVDTTDGKYTQFLDKALTDKAAEFVPDVFVADAAFVLRYSKGEMSGYALPYKDFINNVDTKITNAQIAEYTQRLGEQEDGALVALAYQTTGGGFIYRRSVAEEIFGTDDPTYVERMIGGGTGSWDKFWEVAAECAENEPSIAIVSGDGDLWHPVEASASAGWVVNGNLHIDSKREAFLDYSKNLYDNGWSNKTSEWSTEWYNDVRGGSEKQKTVLGFFGPAWLINYVLEPTCNKDENGNVVNNNTDWAICQAPVDFFWGGTWLFVNKNLANDKSEEGKKKLKAIGDLIEWITLDSTDDGLQYKWANGLLGNVKDTVASKVVMDKSNGELDFLDGQDMFTALSKSNENINASVITEYDEAINAIWRLEVNKYAEGLTTKAQALNNFKYAVCTQLGLGLESSDSVNNCYETEHVRAEPDSNGKGIKFTLTAKEGENWKPGASFIWENNAHYGIRIEDVPKYNATGTAGSSIECYYPLTEDKKVYTFDCELAIDEGKKITESVIVQANGGDAHLTVDGDNFDITLTGKTMTLSKDLSFKMDKSDNVKPYLKYDVNTTNEKTSGERWEVEWKQGLGGGKLPYPEMISALQTDGYDVIYIDSQNLSKLEEDQYYFANLTLEFTIDDYPQSFRTWISAYSDVVKYNFNDLVQNTSEHVSAVPDPDGKGIKFTISAKEGEEWREEDYHITEINSGLYMEINKEKLPKPGKTVVCYWPLANDGESYIFDCDVKLKSEGEKVLHETVVSKAKGSYASVNIDYAALKGLQLNVDSKNATVKLSKDLSRAISASENITATFDFGTFVNESSSEYKWTEWLSTRFPSVTESALYGDGAGISLFNKDIGIVDKLKKYKYFFTDMSLNFEFKDDDDIEERFRYSDGYRTGIIDSTDLLANLNTNTHISAEPCDEGVKITLRRLETDGNWCDDNVNNIICLADNGEDGVSINLVYPQDFWNNEMPSTHSDNRSPTLEEPTVTYIYPFTTSGKVYEFVLAGPIDKAGEWQSEYVRCTAGGGLGELIDVDAWNKDINVTDIDYENHSFRISGDVSALIDNTTNEKFTCTNMWIDIRPGTQENGRDQTFSYSSMETCVIGNHHDHDWYRTVDDLKNPIVIQNHPDYGTDSIDPNASYNEDVYAVLEEYNNLFWVVMSIQEIRLEKYPNMTFHLHWK